MDRWTLAQRIRLLREQHGKSQVEMADMLGISRQAYGRLENGIRDVSFIEIQQITNYLEVDYRNILEEGETQNVSLTALCRDEQCSDNAVVFEKIEHIVGVFLVQEKLFYQMKDRKG
ncbi:MAG: helix-turn-helix transcriptional regulator [Syntrophomonadaceae bacterium]|nr:helix-turn-helix transcriptional regulator [Syntrophomonadaceae bacterium]MDD3889906.1 helix-turn-helix transcriptional regulator [Syntrophomonadaceae bacterium]MDD4549871.1 helix-turn-helix transcriptional regulator [Syntrophomonadaceae bacterium]